MIMNIMNDIISKSYLSTNTYHFNALYISFAKLLIKNQDSGCLLAIFCKEHGTSKEQVISYPDCDWKYDLRNESVC